MKKIWIDGYEANLPQRVGSNQVAFELIKNFEKIDHNNDYTILLPNSPSPEMPKERVNFKYKIYKPRKLKTWIGLPFALNTAKDKPDVFFTPSHYIPRFSPVPCVTAIMDLAYLYYPEMYLKSDVYKLNNWTKYSVTKSKNLITISENTKKDIIKNYHISENKITVCYPGYDNKLYNLNHDKNKTNNVLSKYKINKPYVIFIGTLQPRKNLIKLLEAIKLVPDINLVIVGKTKGLGRQGWMYDEILATPKKLGIEDRVIFTGFAPNEDLPYLLYGAKAYVLPSLYEGFGIPILEAMACGTPVITSNVSSLPEAAGKAGLLVDPNSKEEIAKAIDLLVSDEKQYKKYSQKGLDHVKAYSWEKMAKEVLKVLESI